MGFKQSTDIVLVNFIQNYNEVSLDSRTFSQTNNNTVFHCILGYWREHADMSNIKRS